MIDPEDDEDEGDDGDGEMCIDWPYIETYNEDGLDDYWGD